MIRIGTVYPYRYVHTRESELTLESGIIESCMNRLCKVQCVSYSELHGARRAESNRTCEDYAHDDKGHKALCPLSRETADNLVHSGATRARSAAARSGAQYNVRSQCTTIGIPTCVQTMYNTYNTDRSIDCHICPTYLRGLSHMPLPSVAYAQH